MSKIKFAVVQEKAQIEKIAQIADETWHEYYDSILDIDQIDYMVEKFQSTKAIIGQMINENYQYILLYAEDNQVGYIAIQEDIKARKLFLSKIYILAEFRGKGYASETFLYLESICKEKEYNTIWLTVNKYNENSIKIYERMGFTKIKSQVTQIGEGYVMDDYIMQKEI